MNENRTRKIDVRFTEKEYQEIVVFGKELGLSKANFIRARLLNNSIKLVFDAKKMIAAMNLIGLEFKRSGNNINQLARHANTLNLRQQLSSDIVNRHDDLLEQYISLQSELETLLRTIIRMLIC